VQDHEQFMRLALDEARRAEAIGEVPVDAVVVLDGQVVGRGFNQPIGAVDPTAHARSWRSGTPRAASTTTGSRMRSYVTIEPCLMRRRARARAHRHAQSSAPRSLKPGGRLDHARSSCRR
jgi:tRNA(Arg) A34 adenosine deaminase TadA